MRLIYYAWHLLSGRKRYLLELYCLKQAQTWMSYISTYMTRIYWAICPCMIPAGMIWWALGHAPKGVHPSLPSIAQVWSRFVVNIYTLIDRETWTSHTPLFLKQDTPLWGLQLCTFFLLPIIGPCFLLVCLWTLGRPENAPHWARILLRILSWVHSPGAAGDSSKPPHSFLLPLPLGHRTFCSLFWEGLLPV